MVGVCVWWSLMGGRASPHERAPTCGKNWQGDSEHISEFHVFLVHTRVAQEVDLLSSHMCEIISLIQWQLLVLSFDTKMRPHSTSSTLWVPERGVLSSTVTTNIISHLYETKVISTSCSERLYMKGYTTDTSRLIVFFTTVCHENDHLCSYGIVFSTIQHNERLAQWHEEE